MLRDSKKREEAVLAIIVRRYVETAEPVGSRYVSRRLDLSSATIRNVMADLEDKGLITHPHTSAGRIPTDKGYRYYIDALMRLKAMNEGAMKSIKQEYGYKVRSMEDILEGACHMISGLTNYVGISLFSEYDKLYMDGASHIIEQPEFRDLDKLYHLLRFLEEKRDILRLLHDDFDSDRLTIRIGEESGSNSLRDCSVVTRGYKVRGRLSGKVGAIGPKRMFYEKVIPTVEYLADTVSKMLEELET